VALEEQVARWWQTVKNEITDINDFEVKFLARYWNHDIQKGIKRRLELEKYRMNGRLNRSDYFIERVLTLTQMTPKLEEQDIVIILSEHFESQIQDARRVQNIQTIREFENLLNRYDIEDQNNKIRDGNGRRDNRTNFKRSDEEFKRTPKFGYQEEGINETAYQQNRRHYTSNVDRNEYRPNSNHTNLQNGNNQYHRPRYSSNYRQFPNRGAYSSSYYNQNRPNYNKQEDNRRWESHRENQKFQQHKTEEQEAIVRSFTMAGSPPLNAQSTSHNHNSELSTQRHMSQHSRVNTTNNNGLEN